MKDIIKFIFGGSNRVEDAVIRYLNRKPPAGNQSFSGSRITMLLDEDLERDVEQEVACLGM
ncbi:hypothetical protein Gohar_026393, partial [Gossypium harknessii]|nr:hypothetical protein [Gossypium harknessii]